LNFEGEDSFSHETVAAVVNFSVVPRVRVHGDICKLQVAVGDAAVVPSAGRLIHNGVEVFGLVQR